MIERMVCYKCGNVIKGCWCNTIPIIVKESKYKKSLLTRKEEVVEKNHLKKISAKRREQNRLAKQRYMIKQQKQQKDEQPT